MDLAQEIKFDLQNLKVEKTREYLATILGCLVRGEDENKNLLANQHFCSLQILVVECVRHLLNQQELEDALDDLQLGTDNKSAITEFYKEHRTVLSKKLVKIGTFLPQVVDARWKLECVTQVSHSKYCRLLLFNVHTG